MNADAQDLVTNIVIDAKRPTSVYVEGQFWRFAGTIRLCLYFVISAGVAGWDSGFQT